MNTAFVGLDCIQGIVHPQGRIARTARRAGDRGVIAAANRAMGVAPAEGWLTVPAKVGFAPGHADEPERPPLLGRAHEVGALAPGTPGTEFHPELASTLADLAIVKPRASAFCGTNLDAALRARRVERVVVAGVRSSRAVQSTVRDAHDHDYAVPVVEDACAAADDTEHHASTTLLRTVATSTTVQESDASA